MRFVFSRSTFLGMPTPPKKAALARRLRRSSNLPEQAAWDVLRTLRADGFPVRRQHPVGRFVVDFAIVRARLVIEIDGGVHARADVAARDAERQAALEAMGWRVMRVNRDDALNTDVLLARVREVLGLK